MPRKCQNYPRGFFFFFFLSSVRPPSASSTCGRLQKTLNLFFDYYPQKLELMQHWQPNSFIIGTEFIRNLLCYTALAHFQSKSHAKTRNESCYIESSFLSVILPIISKQFNLGWLVWPSHLRKWPLPPWKGLPAPAPAPALPGHHAWWTGSIIATRPLNWVHSIWLSPIMNGENIKCVTNWTIIFRLSEFYLLP